MPELTIEADPAEVGLDAERLKRVDDPVAGSAGEICWGGAASTARSARGCASSCIRP